MIKRWFIQNMAQHRGRMWLFWLPFLLVALTLVVSVMPLGPGFPRETLIELLLCAFIGAVGVDTVVVKQQKATGWIEIVMCVVAVVSVLMRALA